MTDAADNRARSRRSALRAIGTCSVAGLAGCTFVGNSQNGSSTRPQRDDRTLIVPEGIQLGEHRINLNMFAGFGENVPRRALRYVSAKLGYSHPQTGERLPGLVRDWEYDDTEVTVTFHPDATYSNGDPLDPADFAYGLFLWPLIWNRTLPHTGSAQELYTAIEEIDVTDNTLVLRSPRGYLGQLRELQGDDFWERTIYSGRGWRHFANFRDISEAYWNLRQQIGLDHLDTGGVPSVTEAQREQEEQLRQRLLDRVVTPSEAITTGPFTFDTVGDGTMRLTKHDGYPYADDINVEHVRLDSMPDDRTVWGALRADEVDGVNSIMTPPHVAESFPDHIQQVVSPTGMVSIFQCNLARPELVDHRVRKALSHLIDRGEIARNVHEVVRTPASWNEYLTAEFLDDGSRFREGDDTRALVDSFEAYDHDAARGEHLLREAGFELVDDQWYTPEGERWQISISTAQQNPAVGVTVKRQLEAFGIDVEVVSTEETVLETAVSNGSYELVHRVVPAEWAYTSEVAVETVNSRGVSREINLWQDQLRQSMDNLDFEWDQSPGGRLRLGETVRPYVDDGQLLEFYRDRNLDVLTWVYDPELRRGTFERYDAVDAAEGSVGAGWIDHLTQLQLRLRQTAPPLGDPNGDPIEWPVSFVRSNVSDYPPTGVPTEPRLRTQLALADRWLMNEQLFHLPLVRHRSQGFINTRDWEIPTPWIDDPEHFSIANLVATNNLRAKTDE